MWYRTWYGAGQGGATHGVMVQSWVVRGSVVLYRDGGCGAVWADVGYDGKRGWAVQCGVCFPHPRLPPPPTTHTPPAKNTKPSGLVVCRRSRASLEQRPE